MSLQQDLKPILPDDSLRHDRCVAALGCRVKPRFISAKHGGLIPGVWCRWSEIVFIGVYEAIMVDSSH